VWLGLEGGLLLAIPGALAAALLLRERHYLQRFVPRRDVERTAREEPGQPRALALLISVATLRSMAWFGLITFVPLYEVAHGSSKAEGTRLLTYLLACGAALTLTTGPLADRFGRVPVILWTGVLCVPLVVVYIVEGGPLGAAAVIVAGGLL